MPAGERWLSAGIVKRPHGLDGSVLVAETIEGALSAGRTVLLGEGGRAVEIVSRGGTAARPRLRLAGVDTRAGAEALQGVELMVDREVLGPLGEDEWWAEELEGCRVVDGSVPVGVVARLLALPSCEVLSVTREDGSELLVPLVGDAVRTVDVQRREIDVDLVFLGEDPGPADAAADSVPAADSASAAGSFSAADSSSAAD